MTWRRRTGVLVVVAGLLLPSWPAEAGQRGGRAPRSGGRGDDRGSTRGPWDGPRGPWDGGRGGGRWVGPWVATPWVTVPDIWPGPGDGPYSPLAASRWGRPFGGPVFRGAEGWWPYRDYGFRTGWGAPYYGFQQGMSVAPGLWSGMPVPFPAWQAGVPGVPAIPGVPPAALVPGYPGLPLVPGDPALFMTPHPFYPPPAMWTVPPRVVPPDAAPTGAAPQPDGPPEPETIADVGGLSFELTPADAEVWVDGGYAGRADEFGPNREPLPLLPGPHRLELRAPGHQTVAVDVQVPPGQVLPYRGRLLRLP